MDIKAAIEMARPHLEELFPEARGIRLEGAELSDDRQTWAVTFSFFDSDPGPYATPTDLAKFLNIRAYKTFKISSSNGEFLGFRNGYANAA